MRSKDREEEGTRGRRGDCSSKRLQEEEIWRCAEEEEARRRKEEEARRREEEATERYRLQKEGRAVPDWFYAERIEADARNRQGGGASGGGGWRRGGGRGGLSEDGGGG